MQCYYIDLYEDFSCLAGECPSTCCSGWKIVIDEEAMERFALLENLPLKDDIFSNVQQKNGEYLFQNKQDGRCSMLDDDGLCRIQRNLSEKDLCNTCRKYPRLSGTVGKQLWLSMAASCPVVAGYLWNQEIRWMKKDTEKISKWVENEEVSVVREGLAFYSSQNEQLLQKSIEGTRLQGKERMLWHVKKQWNRFLVYLEVVDAILELSAEFPEQNYLTEYLEYFEKEDQTAIDIVEDMDLFEEKWQEQIDIFIRRYLAYRLFSRKLEHPKENVSQLYTQTMGELSFFYVITFSRFFQEDLTEQGIIENINLTYRFCAHGNKSSERVSQSFSSIFKDISEYLFLLQG